jgi:hypothetical protein
VAAGRGARRWRRREAGDDGRIRLGGLQHLAGSKRKWAAENSICVFSGFRVKKNHRILIFSNWIQTEINLNELFKDF